MSFDIKDELAKEVSSDDRLRDNTIKSDLDKAYNAATSNLKIKAMSFIGMTLLAVVPFVFTGPFSITTYYWFIVDSDGDFKLYEIKCTCC